MIADGWRYVRAHRLTVTWMWVAALLFSQYLTADRVLAIPGIDAGVHIPFRFVLVGIMAMVALGACDARVAEPQWNDTGAVSRWNTSYIVFLTIAGSSLIFVVEIVAGQSDPQVFPRLYLTLCGVGIIAGALVRFAVAWVPVLMALLALTFFTSFNGGGQWWNLGGPPVNNALSWAFAFAVWGLGLALWLLVRRPWVSPADALRGGRQGSIGGA